MTFYYNSLAISQPPLDLFCSSSYLDIDYLSREKKVYRNQLKLTVSLSVSRTERQMTPGGDGWSGLREVSLHGTPVKSEYILVVCIKILQSVSEGMIIEFFTGRRKNILRSEPINFIENGSTFCSTPVAFLQGGFPIKVGELFLLAVSRVATLCLG